MENLFVFGVLYGTMLAVDYFIKYNAYEQETKFKNLRKE